MPTVGRVKQTARDQAESWRHRVLKFIQMQIEERLYLC